MPPVRSQMVLALGHRISGRIWGDPCASTGQCVEEAAGWWWMRCRHIPPPSLMADSGMQVAEEIWVVGDNTVAKWSGTIAEYKEHLKATHAALVDSKPEMTER